MDREYLVSLIEEGLSTYKIAERVGKCQTTVRYWIRKYNLEDKYKTTKEKKMEYVWRKYLCRMWCDYNC